MNKKKKSMNNKNYSQKIQKYNQIRNNAQYNYNNNTAKNSKIQQQRTTASNKSYEKGKQESVLDKWGGRGREKGGEQEYEVGMRKGSVAQSTQLSMTK